MRNIYSLLFIILFICMLLIPLTARGKGVLPPAESYASEPSKTTSDDSGDFRIKTADGIVTLSSEQYVCGVVAAEMPALYHEEALKAQAVAAYTYALYKKASAGGDYDLTSDPSIDQSYITEAAQREKWGSKYDEYSARISAAVKAVSGEYIAYKGKPILAVYHAVSAGRTETAAAVWGKDYPYLQSVECVGDMLCDNYQTERILTPQKLCELLGDGLVLKGEADEIGACEKSDCGTVKKISLGGKNYSGADIRKALDLRSSNFDLTLTEGNFKFLVRGYGHGVGMSQNGADFLADQGSGYREILNWFYTGCTLEKTK